MGMKMKRILAALALVFGLTVPAQAFLAEPIVVGSWEGGAYYNDGNRLFSHCAVGVDYNNGVYLILGWGPSGLYLGFLDERWNHLAVGSQTNVRIVIDDRWDSQGPASVIAQGQLETIMGTEPRPVTAMRRGLLLNATIGKETIGFDLTNTNAAIDALASCYRRHS